MGVHAHLTPGARLRAIREHRGLSREALSTLISFEIGSHYIYLIESGKRPLTTSAALTIAPALAVMPVTLLYGEEAECPFCGREPDEQ
jgi:transcriptional regulator with XRE-family HTH domain